MTGTPIVLLGDAPMPTPTSLSDTSGIVSIADPIVQLPVTGSGSDTSVDWPFAVCFVAVVILTGLIVRVRR